MYNEQRAGVAENVLNESVFVVNYSNEDELLISELRQHASVLSF